MRHDILLIEKKIEKYHAADLADAFRPMSQNWLLAKVSYLIPTFNTTDPREQGARPKISKGAGSKKNVIWDQGAQKIAKGSRERQKIWK